MSAVRRGAGGPMAVSAAVRRPAAPPGVRAMGPLARAVAGALCLLLLLSLGYLGARVALGALAATYRVSVVLGELGQGVVSGTDVKMRGVLVGSVGGIELTDELEAVAELVLDPQYRIPERASFLVSGKTLLGEKQVEVVFDGPYDLGPFLADGALVADPSRVVEVEDVIADLHQLFEAIDTDDLAVVVNDLLGAFDGNGETIARSIDSGAAAARVFARSLDDQVASTRDLSLVAESLGGAGADFNRLGAAIVDGLPTLSENQRELARLLDELRRFARSANTTFTVDRADLDRMLVEGDNVTRLLFDYSDELGQIVSGLVTYTENHPPGFEAEGVNGHAARFQIFLEDDFLTALCEGLPPELAIAAPGCAGPPGAAPALHAPAATPGTGGNDGPVPLSLPRRLTRPELPEREGIEALLRRSLQPVAQEAPR